jgi:hypothetical protein
VTINCAERGLLLLRVRDEMRMSTAAYQVGGPVSWGQARAAAAMMCEGPSSYVGRAAVKRLWGAALA